MDDLAFATHEVRSAPVDIGRSRLPFSVKLAFGAGDAGANLLWQGMSLFLLFFSTEVLKIAPETAGLIALIALIWDGFVDVLVGALADRTRSRWGRYRPYLLFGAVPVAGLFVIVFSPLALLAGEHVAIAALGLQMLFRTAYAIVGIPYGSLTSAMTQDSTERSRLTAFRIFGGALAGLSVALGTLPMARYFGAGSIDVGFTAAAAVLAIGSVILTWVCFYWSREQVDAPASPRVEGYSLLQLPRLLLANPPFLLVILSITLSTTGGAISSTFLPYFFKYVIKDADLMGFAIAASVLTIMLALPVWARLTGRIGKRNVWLAGTLWSSCVSLLFYAAAPTTLGSMIPFVVLAALGGAGVTLCQFAILPDTVEYGEWKTGKRIDAGSYSAMILAQKIAFGFGMWIAGWSLGQIGYTPIDGIPPQSIGKLWQVMLLVPAFLSTLTIAVMWFYPITPELHARLCRILARRHGRSK